MTIFRLVVDKSAIDKNRKDPTRQSKLPTIKLLIYEDWQLLEEHLGHQAQLEGPSELRYARPGEPAPGAAVWIETTDPVVLEKDGGAQRFC